MHSKRAKHRGFTLTELVVAASLLVGLMGIVAPLTVRSGRLWQDTRHQQLAIDELSNQLERLTSLPPEQREKALAELSVSQPLQRTLPSVTLASQRISDDDGERIVLSLNWDRPGNPQPITLVGWLDPMPSNATPVEASP